MLAMQALCQWEAQPQSPSKLLADWLAEQEIPPAIAGPTAHLVEDFWRRQTEVDGMLSTTSSNWSFSRISPVERNIMRVAVTEMTAGDPPPKVAINEAIEIGREFGGAETPRFINGVLDEVFKRLFPA